LNKSLYIDDPNVRIKLRYIGQAKWSHMFNYPVIPVFNRALNNAKLCS
jgi:hypothetical protein